MGLSPGGERVMDDLETPRQAIISVHDVMPETLDSVEAVLGGPLAVFDPARVLLLVVPGRLWSRGQIQRLRVLECAGYEFAGHGWCHEIKRIRGLYHALHSRMISRRAAEHLSLSSDEIASLLMLNAEWFSENGFPKPQLYVPPAWSVGRISAGLIKYQPFRWFEVLTGFWDTWHGFRRFTPLMGFEADTRWRARFLLWHNRLAWRMASGGKYPVRMAIHPNDFNWHLADALRADLLRVESVHWRMVFGHGTEKRIEKPPKIWPPS